MTGFFRIKKKRSCNGEKKTSDTAFRTGEEKVLSRHILITDLIDSMDVSTRHDKDRIYITEIQDESSAKYIEELFRHNLADRIVPYLLSPFLWQRNSFHKVSD